MYPNHCAIIFWRSAKNYKNYGILNFFLAQVHNLYEWNQWLLKTVDSVILTGTEYYIF